MSAGDAWVVHVACPNVYHFGIYTHSAWPRVAPPLKCPICYAFIQSYSMEDHYRVKAHGTMGPELRALVQLRPHEQECTSSLVEKMSNKTKPLCSDPNCETCKKSN